MKIGINTRIYQEKHSGIQNYILNLYSNILKYSKDNEYVFFQTSKNKTLGKTSIIKLKSNNLYNILFDNFLVNFLINKEKIDIFHGPSHILPFLKRKNVKYIVTIHDLAFLIYPKFYKKIFVLYYGYILKRSLKNADIVITVSNNTKEDLKKFFSVDNSKIKVIYPGIQDIFFDKKIEKRLIKDKYFLSITTHSKRKNILSILNILSQNKNLHNYKYVIAGIIGNKSLIDLNKKISDLGLIDIVILYGLADLDKIKNLYHYSDFFIYPSFYEGFGFPVLEAMASKTIVITSDNSSLKEIMYDKRFLVNAFDEKDIYEKIEFVINLSPEERKVIIENNLNYVKSFTWEKSANNLIKVFNNII